MSIKQHPLDDPPQQQIIQELEARVEEERAKLLRLIWLYIANKGRNRFQYPPYFDAPVSTKSNYCYSCYPTFVNCTDTSSSP